MITAYPKWIYYPRSAEPPEWTTKTAAAFQKSQSELDSNALSKSKKSDFVLSVVRSELEALGFIVEAGKSRSQKLYRPVHYKEFGIPDMKYEIDSYHPIWKIGLEVEAVRAIRGNALYRDIIQSSLLIGVDYLVIAVLQAYRGHENAKPEDHYAASRRILDAIYSSERLKLPLKGIQLIGY